MKKFGKLGSILAAGAMTLGMCALAACGGGAEETAYTLIVKDKNGNAMANYMITICEVDANGNKGLCKTPQMTDSEGKVVFEVPEAHYVVSDANTADNITLEGEYHLIEYNTTNVTVVIAQ